MDMTGQRRSTNYVRAEASPDEPPTLKVPKNFWAKAPGMLFDDPTTEYRPWYEVEAPNEQHLRDRSKNKLFGNQGLPPTQLLKYLVPGIDSATGAQLSQAEAEELFYGTAQHYGGYSEDTGRVKMEDQLKAALSQMYVDYMQHKYDVASTQFSNPRNPPVRGMEGPQKGNEVMDLLR